MRAADVRFYLDADVLGLAKVLVQVRSDVTYPGDPGGALHKRLRAPCPITSTSTPDTTWIPEVARRGWLVVTRDVSIAAHRAEIQAVRDHGARLVVLSGREATGTWNQLEIVLAQWRAIERLLDQPGPFICTVTRTSVRRSDVL